MGRTVNLWWGDEFLAQMSEELFWREVEFERAVAAHLAETTRKHYTHTEIPPALRAPETDRETEES